MLHCTSIRYESSDWPVAIAGGPAARKNVDWIDLLPASRLGTWANRERAAIRTIRSDRRERSGGSRSIRPILTKIADRTWNTSPVSPCSACRNHRPLVTTPAAMCASRCRRCGVAPACARVGRRVSQSLVPSLILSRGRARAHSFAPAANSQSAPSSLGGRYRQCLGDSRIERAGELRLPLHQGLQECRSTDTTKNPPDASAYGISCPPSPRRTRPCGERTGCGTFRAALPHTGLELDLC